MHRDRTRAYTRTAPAPAPAPVTHDSYVDVARIRYRIERPGPLLALDRPYRSLG